jgi:glycosyltransferase involved in cell wall biosynthesis
MSEILVSIIIPTFNRSQLLVRAITSVINQKYTNWELIIVDDGSTDETKEVVEKFQEVTKISYFKIENSGVSAARNHGIKLALGEWVAFLDSDDEWLPNKLSLQVEEVLKNNFRLIHGNEIWIRNGKRVNQKKIHEKSGGEIFKQCLHLCLISPSAVIIKKELLEEHNGFNEELIVCEDYDLWLKITSKEEVGFINTPIINKYGGHEGQLSHQYFAMDYWRVKSMFQIRETLQRNDYREELVKVLKKKCNILLNGYQKHKNVKNYQEVKQILDQIT